MNWKLYFLSGAVASAVVLVILGIIYWLFGDKK